MNTWHITSLVMFKSVNTALDKYDNIIIMGDINIDTHDKKHPGYNKLKSFCDALGLSNLVTGKTCFSNQYQSSMYVCMKFFNVNNSAKLKTCLQPGSQSKKLKSKLKF